MANKKISALPPATAVTSADVMPIVDVGVSETKKVTVNQLVTSFADLSGGTKTAIPLAVSSSTDLGVYVVLGAYGLDPDNFSSVELVTIASVTGSALTGEIQLWNLTDNVEVVVNSYAGNTTPERLAVPVTLASGLKLYEIRHRVTGGSTSSDRINTSWAGLEVSAKLNILV